MLCLLCLLLFFSRVCVPGFFQGFRVSSRGFRFPGFRVSWVSGFGFRVSHRVSAFFLSRKLKILDLEIPGISRSQEPGTRNSSQELALLGTQLGTQGTTLVEEQARGLAAGCWLLKHSGNNAEQEQQLPPLETWNAERGTHHNTTGHYRRQPETCLLSAVCCMLHAAGCKARYGGRHQRVARLDVKLLLTRRLDTRAPPLRF